MNGYELEKEILDKNLDFVRVEIERIRQIRDQLKADAGARSDDAYRLLNAYCNVINELSYLLRSNYDAEK